MAEYTELIKALRCCIPYPPEKCVGCTYNIGNNECAVRRMMTDAAYAIEALQADIKRLKEANDELREAQTYIDHYGDRWMTSAKDVPTAAYKHGYADGRDEAEEQLPKRGEWITIRLNNGGSYTGCSCCEAPIPTDTMLDYIPESESKYCYSCGAKMEVQE